MITQVDGNEEQPVEVGLKPATRVVSSEAGIVGLNYWTETCTLELLFAEYISSLIPAAESFGPDEQLTSSDLDQVIYLVRVLRETAVGFISVYIRETPVDVNPFFVYPSMPQITVAREAEFNASHTIPIHEYLPQLQVRYPAMNYDVLLSNVAEPLFKIGVSARLEDAGKHFILLPDQKELLRAARDNQLCAVKSY